jgi:hypothetical protein
VTSGTDGGRKDCAEAGIIPMNAAARGIKNGVFISQRLAGLLHQVMWHKMATFI